MNNLEQLINITSAYLDDTLDYKKLSDASKNYKALLQQLSGSDLNTENGRAEIYTENGKAIGSLWAALCLDDIIRTRQFIRGIYAAINDTLKKTNEQIHVLYAGTGPYATLLLPLVGRFAKEKIRYTFLEINPFTFDIMKRVAAAAGLCEYNISFELTDATAYHISADNTPDIIVSETMQRNLANEHQVPIFLNLIRQARPDTIFIPEKIALHVGLKKAGHPHEAEQNYYKPLNKVIEISRDALQELIADKEKHDSDLVFAEAQTTIDPAAQQDFQHVMLFTDINVYKDFKITVDESSLTLPKKLAMLPEEKNKLITINSRYKAGAKPGLEYEVVM